MKRLPFPVSSSKSAKCFDFIHVDIWGPFGVPSVFGHKYFLTIVDDYSRHIWIFLMKTKFQPSPLVQNFFHLVQNRFNIIIKILHNDNGLEFSRKSFYATKDVIHQMSCIKTPQQNAMVKHKH